jgi:transcriptional regulator with XRE-family HTH domain
MEALMIVDTMTIDRLFNTMGKRIHILRKDRGMSQTEMAERMGEYSQRIEPSYLSQIERGDKVPSLAVFEAIVIVLEASADYLLLLTDEPDLPVAA